MKPTTFMMMSAVLMSACSLAPIDPCAETSPFQVDPKVAEACEANETGGDDDAPWLCFEPDAYDYAGFLPCVELDGDAMWRAQIRIAAETHYDADYTITEVETCDVAARYICWWDEQSCAVCNTGGNYSATGEAFAIAEGLLLPEQEWIGALPISGWASSNMQTLTPYLDGTLCQNSVKCWDIDLNCDCTCTADAQCVGTLESEQVCEGGLCFYTSETQKHRPDTAGPQLYGVQRWEDGIQIVGNRVVVTGTFAWLALQNAAMDDMTIDIDGTITHCGTGSLCEHLGLVTGERIVADASTIDDLLDGIVVTVEVEPVTGGSRWVSVSIDFDGDLWN